MHRSALLGILLVLSALVVQPTAAQTVTVESVHYTSGVPQWTLLPTWELRYPHGIATCGCTYPSNGLSASGFDDFIQGWAFVTPASGMVEVSHRLACFVPPGGAMTLSISADGSSTGTPVATVTTGTLCAFQYDTTVSLTALGFTEGEVYILWVSNPANGVPLSGFTVTPTEPVPVHTSTWGAVKSLYRE